MRFWETVIDKAIDAAPMMVGGYLAWQWWKNRKKGKIGGPMPPITGEAKPR